MPVTIILVGLLAAAWKLAPNCQLRLAPCAADASADLVVAAAVVTTLVAVATAGPAGGACQGADAHVEVVATAPDRPVARPKCK